MARSTPVFRCAVPEWLGVDGLELLLINPSDNRQRARVLSGADNGALVLLRCPRSGKPVAARPLNRATSSVRRNRMGMLSNRRRWPVAVAPFVVAIGDIHDGASSAASIQIPLPVPGITSRLNVPEDSGRVSNPFGRR